MKLMEIAEIVALLEDRIEALVAELLPLGRREGREWVEASKANGGLGDSLSVCLVGAKRGIWKHFAADAAGDPLDLIAYLKFNGNKGEALRWARGWLGIDSMDPARLATTKRVAADSAGKARAAETAEREKKSRQARAIWLSGVPLTVGGPVGIYLAGRGISLSQFARLPGAIRYLAECWNAEMREKMPAMVAAINGPDGKICAVHRTYLAINRDGSVSKAPLKAQKMVLGGYAGGAVRIWRGEAIDAGTGEVKIAVPLARAGPGQEVVIAEGIENALEVAQGDASRRVLAAISVGNMGQVVLPDTVESVILMADNDAAGAPAALAFDRVVSAHLRAGRGVKVARAPAGFKDINDYCTKIRNDTEQNHSHKG